MNDEEIRSTIEQVRAQVKAKPENQDKTEDEIDEMILDGFFKAYTEGKMSKEDLQALAAHVGEGYELDEGFEQDQEAASEITPEQGEAGEGEGAEGLTKEELEETRTIGEGESKEEFEDKIEDAKEGDAGEVEEGSEEGSEAEEDSEEEERRKASELWKMNLNK